MMRALPFVAVVVKELVQEERGLELQRFKAVDMRQQLLQPQLLRLQLLLHTKTLGK